MKMRRREFIIGAGAGAVPSTAIARTLIARGGQQGASSGGKPGSLPVPVLVTLTPSSATVFDNATSGTVLCSIAVTMSDSSTFTGILTQDGSFTQISGGNQLSLSRGLTGADDGSYTIHVTATENSGSAMAPFALTVSPPTPPGSAFVTATTIGSTRADSGDLWRGFKITVGSNPLQVTAIGRWVGPLNGSVHTHNLGIYMADPVTGRGILMYGTGVTVDISTGTPGTYKYVSLTSNVILWPGTTYWVTSDEPGGGVGDIWYGTDTSVSTTADATMVGGAYFDPSDNFLVDTSSGNHPMVPVNFQYNVGAPGTNDNVLGSPFTGPTFIGVVQLPFRAVFVPRVASGSSVAVSGVFNGGYPPDTWTYQYYIHNASGAVEFISPTQVSTNPNLPWTMDTTVLTDGTKVIYAKILDAVLRKVNDPSGYASVGNTFVVNNHGHSEGAQNVPVTSWSSTGRWTSPAADSVHYDGVPNPIHNTYPMPYTFVSSAAGNTTYRDPGQWYFSSIIGTHYLEYECYPGWATSVAGQGVMSWELEPLSDDSTSTEAAYNPVKRNAPSDGTRLNTFTTAYINLVEDPDVSGQWWFAEISGRVGTISRTGTVTTVAGFRRNKSVLVFPYSDATGDQQEGNFETVGTFPPGADMGGANDLCFDPRNHDYLYVACQVDNWIAQVRISTQTVTVYSGTPGASDAYSGDGGPASAALWSHPSSLIMDSSGNLYVVDQFNCAIRKITSSSPGTAGTITTVYGGSTWTGWAGHGSVPLAPTDINSQYITYNVATTSWNSGTSTLTVTMVSSPTPIFQLGFRALMSGATNSGGSGNPNIIWQINSFTSPTSFTMVFAPDAGNNPPSSIGTLTGSITLQSFGIEVYSSPTTVTTTSTGGQFWRPNAIRFTAAGNIVVFEGSTMAARLIRLNTGDGGSVGTISRIGLSGNTLGSTGGVPTDPTFGPAWIWGDVDSAGTCGGLNDVFYWNINNGVNGAHASWRSSLAAADSIGTPSYGAVAFSDPSSLPTWAPWGAYNMGQGHYPWAVALSRVEGKITSTGISQMGPTLINITLGSPTQPPVNISTNLNIALSNFNNGYAINISGTSPMWPMGIRPAFAHLYGTFGQSFILNTGNIDTFEDLMHGIYAPGGSGDTNLATLIQAGMAGATARPEITGNVLRDYIYFIRRGTLQGSDTTPPIALGPDAVDNAPALFLTLSITRTSTTTIQATWTTDKLAIGCLVGASTTQFGMNCFPMYSNLEAGFGTSHSVTMRVIESSLVTPIYCSVVMQTVGGIFTHTTPIAIT